MTQDDLPPATAISDALRDQQVGPTAPSLVTGFTGLSSGDNPFALVPPDPQLAAGPAHLVEMVNVVGKIFDKSGSALSTTFTLASFFGTPTGYNQADPKVIFDAASGRFFATYFSYCDNATFFCATDEGRLHLAVSTTNNPFDSWYVYSRSIAEDMPDYPGIGVADDKVTVSYNRFDIDTRLYTGVQTLVFQKSDLMAGLTVDLISTAPDLTHFTIRPAHSLTSTTTQYMASISNGTLAVPAAAIHLWRITGTPEGANVAVSDVAHPAIGSLVSPCSITGLACAQQSGTSGLVDTGDNRVLDAEWRNNKLWVSATGACAPVGDSATRSCLKLIEVDTTSNTVLQDGLFGASGFYLYYPALRTDAAGNLHVVYSRSSASEFVQTRIASRMSSDPINTLTSDVQLKGGEVAFLPGIGSSPYRWGDYLGAAVDPSDTSVVWLLGEYAKNDLFERWGTWIAKMRYPAAPTPSPTPVPAADAAMQTTTVNFTDGVNPITSAGAGANFTVRVSAATINNGPSTVDLQVTTSLSGIPPDCTRSPAGSQSESYAAVGSGQTRTSTRDWTVNCSTPSNHQFGGTGSVSITSAITDSNPGNNGPLAGDDTIPVLGQTDAAVTGLTVIAPATATQGVAFDVTVSADLHNGGTVTPATADAILDLPMPADCSRSPNSSQAASGLNLVLSATLTTAKTWSVTCNATGLKVFSGSGSVTINQLHVSDVNSANNSSNANAGTDVTAPATPTPVPGDADGDHIPDAAETACGSAPGSNTSIPERLDGAFAGVDDDGDTEIDEALPGGASVFDCDGDGFAGSAETYVFSASGGQDQDPCGDTGWPADFVSSAPSTNKVDIQDVVSYVAPVYYLFANVGTHSGDIRWDLVQGTPGDDINIVDLTSIITLAPPMLGGGPALFNSCPWPP